MRQRFVLVGVLAALVVVALVAAVLAHGSQAAPRLTIERPPAGPAPVPGPAALPEAAATIQRTFVSTAGSDANPCTPTQPCRSFPVAIANTTAGGEVIALDSGGYGVFTVDKALTIAGAPGAHVAVTAFTATAITVNAGASDAVVLRNLYLTGLGGDTGIFFQAGGSLHVESIVASGFQTYGLDATGADATAAAATLVVRNSVFRHNGSYGARASGNLRVEVAGSRVDHNGVTGFSFAEGARGSVVDSSATENGFFGFLFDSGAVFAVSRAVADGNDSLGVGVFADTTQVSLSDVVLSNNTHQGLATSSGAPVARLGGSTVTGNGLGLWRDSGTLESYGDNMVRGNTANTLGTITTVGKT